MLERQQNYIGTNLHRQKRQSTEEEGKLGEKILTSLLEESMTACTGLELNEMKWDGEMG